MDNFENWETLPSLADAGAEEVARAAADVLDAKKGKNVVVLSVAGQSDVADALVLATANTASHVQALADEVEYRLGQRGVKPLHTDGHGTKNWQVLDFGDVMVHVFDREARDFYHLDKLYGGAEGAPEEKE